MAPTQTRGPHRWQASSHRSCPHIPLQERACLAMAPTQTRARIAGKPAPTEAVPTYPCRSELASRWLRYKSGARIAGKPATTEAVPTYPCRSELASRALYRALINCRANAGILKSSRGKLAPTGFGDCSAKSNPANSVACFRFNPRAASYNYSHQSFPSRSLGTQCNDPI